jgi:integral membrane sensor domain MASE1
MERITVRSASAYLGWIVVVAAAYVAGGKLGLSLAFGVPWVSAVWPPTGIAVAAMILGGRRLWPGVFIGAYIVNITTPGENLLLAFLISIGNTIGPLLGAWILRRLRFDPSFSKVIDVLEFVAFGSLLAMMVSATNGVAQLVLAHKVAGWAAIGYIWPRWWVGDAMGVLLIAPPILTWARWRRSELPTEASLLEIAGLLAATFVVSGYEFLRTLPFAFPLYPMVVWSAFRASARVTTTSIVAVIVLAIYGTIPMSGSCNSSPSRACSP